MVNRCRTAAFVWLALALAGGAGLAAQNIDPGIADPRGVDPRQLRGADQAAGDQRSIDLPYERWLGGPDRREIKWELTLSPPRLTYDLRHLMLLGVEVAESALLKLGATPDLHLLIKAGDGTHWYGPENYTHFPVPKLGEKVAIQFLSALYLRAGRHEIGIVLYDSANQKLSVTRRWVTVAAVKHDPLPQLDGDLPAVEFATVSGDDAPAAGKPWHSREKPKGPRVSSSGLDLSAASNTSMLPATPETRTLRLRSSAALQVDVLVDFTPTSQFQSSSLAYSLSESAMWGMLRILALVKPAGGCVLLTGIDVLGQRVLFERVNAAAVDWQRLAELVAKLDAHTVDVRTLEAHKRMSEFFRNQMSRLMETDDAGCTRSVKGAPLQHIYIIAADGVAFPSGTPRTAINTTSERSSKFYYLRRGNPWDEMGSIVKPLHPRRLSADTPMKFRESLAKLIADLGGAQ